ncbi:MAG: helix-turn-helix domain-containing protein [Bacteroidetes bacterium]|nr:helix-turn-helix domain-containing protein [Bacteroidota bacterium]
MELNLVNVIILLAAAQGLLLALLLFQKHRALFANRYLALLMLSYTAVLVHLVLQDTGLYLDHSYLFLLSGLALAALPLHYLYTQHLIFRSQTISKNEFPHFIPFIVYEIILLIAIITNQIDLSDGGEVHVSKIPLLLQFYSISVIVLGLFYLGLSLRLIRRYNDHVKDVVSSIETVQLTWLRNITYTGGIAVSIFCVEELFLLDGINLSNFIFSSIGFAVYVYGMGYLGLLKSEIFSERSVEKAMQTVEEIEISSSGINTVKYERSGLSDETAKQYLQSLLMVMRDQKTYRNSSLTLTELSETLSISPHNLSEVINTKLQKNFYDFVNGYRLEEVKNDLADPTKHHLKILSIAFDAGFNSKATFNTLFKEQTGKTPTEYRKSVLTSASDE